MKLYITTVTGSVKLKNRVSMRRADSNRLKQT